MASHHQPEGTFYLDRATLQCKAGCGFFGNPEWFGYCSVCFKQLNQYQQQQQQYHQLQRLHHPANQQQNQPRYQQQQQPYSHNHSPVLVHQQSFPEQQRLYHQRQYQRQQRQLQRQAQQITRPYQTSTSRDTQHITATTAATQIIPLPQTKTHHTSQPATKSPIISGLHQQPLHTIGATTPGPSPSATIASPASGSSLLSTSNSFLGNITSPTSLVQMGYDTLSNLHTSIVNTAKSSFRASPSASTDGKATSDTSSIRSTSQSEYLISRSKGTSGIIAKKQWSNILNPSGSSRKGSLDQQSGFPYDMAWVDCLNHTNKFAEKLLAVERRSDKNINDLSDMVHDFYELMSQRFERQLTYRGASSDQLELLNDNMERILNEHIYHVISARIINEDEDHNMAIMKRIRSLNWITVEHLEIEIDFQRPIVHDLLDKAICQMVEMNSRTSSIDKLECIVQCSKTIFELLQVGPPTSECGNSIPVSADQFLPVLVFVVIQANPPMLPADMKYLARFSNPHRLMSGETGYYFTNLCCALEFIEKASGASLNISEEEFTRYINGEATPETKSQFHTYLCDGLRTMCSNGAALKKLQADQETRSKKMDSLLEQIDVHLETSRAKLKEMEEFSASLSEKLKPKPMNLQAINKEMAAKLRI